MQLKLFVLSASALTLWLVPLVGLNKQVSWHKAIQGISLCSAIACAVAAGNIAKYQADEDEIETIKARAIKADVIDEISTSAYISQTQRQQEAEQLLNPVEHLERALALPDAEVEHSEARELIAQKQLAKNEVEPEPEPEKNDDAERLEQIMQLRARGYSKAKIILELWGVSKGGSAKYKAAEAEYHRIIDGGKDDG